ncbi:MAG: type II toxin-antitoxin system prevent-host-death family antitoxin [Chloroflexota bacterium]
MQRTISATQARIRFGELMQEAQKGPVIVEKDGKPQVVVLSKQAYDRLVAAAPHPGWRDRLQDAHARLRQEAGARTLPAPEDLIQQARQERHEPL